MVTSIDFADCPVVYCLHHRTQTCGINDNVDFAQGCGACEIVRLRADYARLKAAADGMAKELRVYSFTNGINMVCNCCGRLPHKEGCSIQAALASYQEATR